MKKIWQSVLKYVNHLKQQYGWRVNHPSGNSKWTSYGEAWALNRKVGGEIEYRWGKR